VSAVQHVTFSGCRARELRQDVTFITERCVIRLMDDGLTVTEVAPGISVQRDILDRTSVALRISPELRQMDARLFRPDPIGLRLADRAA
jgi:acyl CoA:acetate/3-ketoacid CoA transferase